MSSVHVVFGVVVSITNQGLGLGLHKRGELEKIQNYAMRIILSQPPRTSSEDLRKKLGWTTVERRMKIRRLALVHRCVTERAPNFLSKLLKKTTHGKTRRKFDLILPYAKTEVYRRSFSFQASIEWNKISSVDRNLSTSNFIKKLSIEFI